MPSIQGLIGATGGLVSYAITLLAGIALLVFFWGLAKFIFHAGSTEKKDEGKNVMFWGIISLFVMVSVWGIVYFFQRSFGLVVPNNIVDPMDIPDWPENSPFNPGNTPSDKNV
ncbi:MAG: pilin [Patescibacteria group bacterium]